MSVIENQKVPLYDSPYSFSQSIIPRTASRLTGGIGVIYKKPTIYDGLPIERKQASRSLETVNRFQTDMAEKSRALEREAPIIEPFQVREAFSTPRPATSLNIIAIVSIIICILFIAGFIYFIFIQHKQLKYFSSLANV